MHRMFNKPNYIDEKYVEATNSGWIDNRTGEILVSIPRMLDRMKEKGLFDVKEVTNQLASVQPIDTKILEPFFENKSESTVDEPEKQDVLDDLLNMLIKVKANKDLVPTEDKPRRGRPRKVKEPQEEGVVISKRRGRPKKNV